MKWWSSPSSVFPYSSDDLISVFWDRYPNSFAKHILSEDVLDRKITEYTITTKKLIVKQGSSVLKRVPKWISRMTDIRVVPVIEESVYDRRTKTLTTYTRNVCHLELFSLHEKCFYKPSSMIINSVQHPSTDIIRHAFVDVNCGRMSSLYEQVLLMGFKKSVTNTTKGINEKLEERFGPRNITAGQKLEQLKEKLKTSLVTQAKLQQIGFIAAAFGLSDAVCSLVFGPLIKLFGRMPLFVFGAVVNLLMILTLMIWPLNPADTAIFYVVAWVWGMADGVWNTQINGFWVALVGRSSLDFAFTNYRIWESLGIACGYAMARSFTVEVYLYVSAGALLIGMVGYSLLENYELVKNYLHHMASVIVVPRKRGMTSMETSLISKMTKSADTTDHKL